MPSLTTGELVILLQNKNILRLRELTDPDELMKAVDTFLKKNKDLPAGLTITQISDALEDMASREYGRKRNPNWNKVRKAHIKKQPACQACGQIGKCSVHHIRPYHLRPDMECQPDNLITLCENSDRFGWSCHFLIAHLGDWKLHNPNVVKCAKYVRELVAGDSK